MEEMGYLPAVELATAYERMVDVAAVLPGDYLSEVRVYVEEEPRVAVCLGRLAYGQDPAKVQTHILNMVDGAGLSNRAESRTVFPDGTPLTIYPYWLEEAGVPPEDALLPGTAITGLRAVQDFLKRSAVLANSLETQIWSPRYQADGRTQRINTTLRACYYDKAEFAAIAKLAARAKTIFSRARQPARVTVAPSYVWELELPRHGQTLTLHAADFTPAGQEEERRATGQGQLRRDDPGA